MSSEIVVPMDAAKTEQVLQQRLRSQAWNLRLEASEGGVILHGVARNYHAKQLAQHMVMKLLKAPILANLIEVRRGSDAEAPLSSGPP